MNLYRKFKTAAVLPSMLLCFSAIGSGSALAADDILGYTSTVYSLDDADANSKKVRLIYQVQSAWNKSHIPEPIKEVKFVLNAGSGFDMTGVPKKRILNEVSWYKALYQYTVPTNFQLKVGYYSGLKVRHMDHEPQNTILSATVSDSVSYNLGFGANAGMPTNYGVSASAGASWTSSVSYSQPEFQTYADYNDSDKSVSWNILNKTIRNHTPPKDWLIDSWVSCSASNLINVSELPIVMQSDFRPQTAILYRKDQYGNLNTIFNIQAAWQKTNYHFARDWCNWYVDRSDWPAYLPYDNVETTKVDRQATIGWTDHLYH